MMSVNKPLECGLATLRQTTKYRGRLTTPHCAITTSQTGGSTGSDQSNTNGYGGARARRGATASYCRAAKTFPHPAKGHIASSLSARSIPEDDSWHKRVACSPTLPVAAATVNRTNPDPARRTGV